MSLELMEKRSTLVYFICRSKKQSKLKNSQTIKFIIIKWIFIIIKWIAYLVDLNWYLIQLMDLFPIVLKEVQ